MACRGGLTPLIYLYPRKPRTIRGGYVHERRAGPRRSVKTEGLAVRAVIQAIPLLLCLTLAAPGSAQVPILDNIDAFVPDGTTYYENAQLVDYGAGYVSFWVVEDFRVDDLSADITRIEWLGKYSNEYTGGSELTYTAEIIVLEERDGVIDPDPLPYYLAEGLTFDRAGTEIGSDVVERFGVDLPVAFVLTPGMHVYVGVRLKSDAGFIGGNHGLACTGNPALPHSDTSAAYRSDFGFPDWTLMSTEPFWNDNGHLEYAIQLLGEHRDCDGDGTPDYDEIQGGADDCNTNWVPDECELDGNDCNTNGIPDECDITSGFSQDENENDIPDECEFDLGDLNCDGWVNNGDIDAFVDAISDPPTYAATYPDCDINLGDINQDGWVNNGDIDAFVDLIAPR